MRIVTWNCNGALRNKHGLLDVLKPDILVVQECEDPDRSTKKYKDWADKYLWIGKSKNKGLGVFVRNNLSLNRCKWDGEFSIGGLNIEHPASRWRTSELESFLPCQVGNHFLLAVWTKQAGSPIFGHIGQLWKYLQIHHSDIAENKCMVIGDFNSNAIWDKSDRWWNHSDVVNELRSIGLESLYHVQFNEEQGEENVPTFYMYRMRDKPYHIDYVFLPKQLLEASQLTIGNKEGWLGVSDHMPLIVDVAL